MPVEKGKREDAPSQRRFLAAGAFVFVMIIIFGIAVFFLLDRFGQNPTTLPEYTHSMQTGWGFRIVGLSEGYVNLEIDPDEFLTDYSYVGVTLLFDGDEPHLAEQLWFANGEDTPRDFLEIEEAVWEGIDADAIAGDNLVMSLIGTDFPHLDVSVCSEAGDCVQMSYDIDETQFSLDASETFLVKGAIEVSRSEILIVEGEGSKTQTFYQSFLEALDEDHYITGVYFQSE